MTAEPVLSAKHLENCFEERKCQELWATGRLQRSPINFDFAVAGILILRISRASGCVTTEYQLLWRPQTVPHEVALRHFPLMQGITSKTVENRGFFGWCVLGKIPITVTTVVALSWSLASFLSSLVWSGLVVCAGLSEALSNLALKSLVLPLNLLYFPISTNAHPVFLLLLSSAWGRNTSNTEG